MTKLYYVGFNGYHQCPKIEGLPKVILKWTFIEEDGTVIGYTHRFIVLGTETLFKIYGAVNHASSKRLELLNRPAGIDNFGSCDEFLIASNETDIFKYNYQNSEWFKWKLTFVNKEHEYLWKEGENKILKFSFQTNLTDIFLLLKNGSVWMLSQQGRLKLIHPYDLDKAVDVCSGLEHSVILTESGCVLTFGNGSRGQLGHGDLDHAVEPVQVAALEGFKVIKIATGGWHSCAITDSGDLYVWGWNNYGQLSAFKDGEDFGLTALPVFVEVGEKPDMKAVDVACGRRHTVVVLDSGDLYSAGWNTYGQLGIDASCEKVPKFTKCKVQRSKNQKVICGPWYTILIEESK